MKALTVLAIVMIILLLLSLIRVGGVLTYSKEGLLIRIRVGKLRFTVYPMKKRARKEKRVKPAEKPPDQKRPDTAPKAGGSLELVRQLLPLITDAAGRFKNKIRIDVLNIDLTVAAPDPAMAAIAFGGVNAAMGMMIPLIENNFNVKERRVRTNVDFDRDKPVIALTAAFSLTIGQGVVLSVRLGVQALRVLLPYRKGQKQKEAV